MMWLVRLLAKIYFSKIEIKGRFPNEASFYVSNHRNGLFRDQIAIYRYPENMNEMRHNRKELSRINNEIANNTSVLMFPEGTSHLGKGLLEIKEGVSHVVSSLNEPKFVPIGLHYEKGWSFRSHVFIQIGEPVTLTLDNKKETTKEIKNQLELVYDDGLQFQEPKKNPLLAISLFPIILLFFLTNLLVLMIPYYVSKKFADDNNVIALWRILSGVPIFILQSMIYIGFSIFYPILLVGYLLITFIGLFTYRLWKDAAGLD